MFRPSAAPRWITKTKRRSVSAEANTMRGATSIAPAPAPAHHRKSATREHRVHLLRKSGDTSSSASAVGALSARDDGARGRIGQRPGEQLRAERAGVERVAGARRETLRQLDAAHERIGRGPACGDVVVTGGRARPPDRLAELREQRRGSHALPRSLRSSPRSDDTVQSHGVLNLALAVDHASGESTSVR